MEVNLLAVLAGGDSTRWLSELDTTPKPLAIVGSRRLVEYMLEAAARAGISHIVAAVSAPSSTSIVERLKTDDRFVWSFVDQRCHGSGCAVAAVSSVVGENDFVLSAADIVCRPDLLLVFLHEVDAIQKDQSPNIVLLTSPYRGEDGPVWVHVDATGCVTNVGKTISASDVVYGGVRWVSSRLALDSSWHNDALSDSENLRVYCTDNPGAVYGVIMEGLSDVDRPGDVAAALRTLG